MFADSHIYYFLFKFAQKVEATKYIKKFLWVLSNRVKFQAGGENFVPEQRTSGLSGELQAGAENFRAECRAYGWSRECQAGP